jgi:hypothetical protein
MMDYGVKKGDLNIELNIGQFEIPVDQTSNQFETVDLNNDEVILDLFDCDDQEFEIEARNENLDKKKTSRIIFHHNQPYSIDLEGCLITEYIPERFGNLMGAIIRVSCYRTHTKKNDLREFIVIRFENYVLKETIRDLINSIYERKEFFFYSTKIDMSVYSNHARNIKKKHHHGVASRSRRNERRMKEREKKKETKEIHH